MLMILFVLCKWQRFVNDNDYDGDDNDDVERDVIDVIYFNVLLLGLTSKMMLLQIAVGIILAIWLMVKCQKQTS